MALSDTTKLGLQRVDTSDPDTRVRTAHNQAVGVLDEAITHGHVAGDDLENALADELGATKGGRRHAGGAWIPATQSTGATGFSALGTPDRVPSLVVGAHDLIFVAYRATWWSSVAGAGRAAIFVNGAQLMLPGFGGPGFGPGPVEVATPNGTGAAPLASCESGLMSDNGASNLSYAGDGSGNPLVLGAFVVPGDFRGGACVIEAPSAGTYDVDVRFRVASSGLVTVQNRRLRVWTRGGF